MPCERVEFPGGGVGHICHRGRTKKAKPCAWCGGPSGKLCDAPIVGVALHGVAGTAPTCDTELSGTAPTCDAELCIRCAISHGPDLDFCPEHLAPITAPFVARDVGEWAEYFHERAAIAQFDGGYPYDQANTLARRLAGPQPSSCSPRHQARQPALPPSAEQLGLAGFDAWRPT